MKYTPTPVPNPELDPDGFVAAVDQNFLDIEAAVENAAFRTGDTMDWDLVLSGGVVGNGRVVEGEPINPEPELELLFGRWRSDWTPTVFNTNSPHAIDLGGGVVSVWQHPNPVSWAGGWAPVRAFGFFRDSGSAGEIHTEYISSEMVGSFTYGATFVASAPSPWLPEYYSPILPHTFTFELNNGDEVSDDGSGGFAVNGSPVTGAVDYDTGVWSITITGGAEPADSHRGALHAAVFPYGPETAELPPSLTVYFYREYYDGGVLSGDLTLTTWIDGVREVTSVAGTDVQDGSFEIEIPPGTISFTYDVVGSIICGAEPVLTRINEPFLYE